MAKADGGTLLSELTSVGLYKRNQGRLTRQLTAGALMLIALAGGYIMSRGPLAGSPQWMRTLFPLSFVGILSWLAFRLVNLPSFAEFLIAVEGEMAKVSWPSKQELIRATTVVIGSMAFLTLVLFLFDAFWAWLLTTLGVVVT
ncbi:MAG TPA: preprotein translocase subunit SecE [Planctomycetaceae bacterium]|jgi:preprotein translocase subunit SecE|nr:preprotein translocase subunit SecE [Planctomycetaceae bacterium]